MARLKIEISVPESHAERIIDALHAVGAGRLGDYERCASLTRITGTWRPLAGAQPYDGAVGEVRYADECRVESVCEEEQAAAVLRAVRDAHPYEEAAVSFLPLYEP
ncbi:hypothetical protein I3F58_25760 [Streptomyces sp. MUM 203J]|uniref:hypothetical protein n=1 Tax=Streptomyces sp. MUM 203J TaxID=2791990 RepID=UPI001F03E1A0|nr:hypothetical protein [Streptomyces sp. MUM 203J]MCH0542902.1 hypothetical protein [Streptomyces sp. MUM 203J]